MGEGRCKNLTLGVISSSVAREGFQISLISSSKALAGHFFSHAPKLLIKLYAFAPETLSKIAGFLATVVINIISSEALALGASLHIEWRPSRQPALS